MEKLTKIVEWVMVSSLAGSVGLTVVALLVSPVRQARAGFAVGDKITGINQIVMGIGLYSTRYTYGGPDTGTVASTPTTFNILSNVDSTPLETITLTPNQLVITVDSNAGYDDGNSFNGVVFSDDNPNVSDVTIASSSISGLDTSRLSYDSQTISLNLEGLNFNVGQSVVLDIGPAVGVPEPTSLALLGVGTLLGLGGYAWRRRRASSRRSSPSSPSSHPYA